MTKHPARLLLFPTREPSPGEWDSDVVRIARSVDCCARLAER